MRLKSVKPAVRSVALVAVVTASIAACSDEAVVRDDPGDDRIAAGEVLGGTISDDMLLLDTVQSQSPPLRSEGSSSAASAGERETENAVAEESPSEQAAPAEAEASTEAVSEES